MSLTKGQFRKLLQEAITERKVEEKKAYARKIYEDDFTDAEDADLAATPSAAAGPGPFTDADKDDDSVLEGADAGTPSWDDEERVDYEKGKVGDTIVENSDTDGFFYLERGGKPSNAFNPASFNNDPAEFAQRIMKHLDDNGRPLTFNVYSGDPFEVAKQYAVLQVIGGKIIEPEPNESDDAPEILTSPEEERYLAGEE